MSKQSSSRNCVREAMIVIFLMKVKSPRLHGAPSLHLTQDMGWGGQHLVTMPKTMLLLSEALQSREAKINKPISKQMENLTMLPRSQGHKPSLAMKNSFKEKLNLHGPWGTDMAWDGRTTKARLHIALSGRTGHVCWAPTRHRALSQASHLYQLTC